VVERTVGVDQDLLAFAMYVFKVWHKLPEVQGWKRKQEPVAGPI
jgi:hypothetical protein